MAKHVKWTDKNRNIKNENKDSEKYQTKHFINLIKIRLSLLNPSNQMMIARNEAHVRLMSSVWYLLRYLIKLSIAGILIGLLILYILYEKKNGLVYNYLTISMVPSIILFFSIIIRGRIENILHYQRIREIVYVIETANFIDTNKDKIFYKDAVVSENP